MLKLFFQLYLQWTISGFQIHNTLVSHISDMQSKMEEEYVTEKLNRMKQKENKALILTVLIERESLFTILTERERFLLNSKGGGNSSPSIISLRLRARDPKTLLSSHIAT